MQTSKTAYKVALNILTLGAKPETAGTLPSGIVDATEKLLIASDAVGAGTLRRYRSPWMVRVYEAFDWMMPGQFEAFAHRKAFCERQVREAIAEGATQVLVLGAGYDTMGWRLAPEFPDVKFFEIDHPGTASFKAKGVEKIGQRSNLHLIAADLGLCRLVDVLSHDDRWDSSAGTIIVAEGLLQYLPPQAVEDLFIQCAALSDECKMAFTFIPARPDGRPDAGPWTNLVLWLLKAGKEPWYWSVGPEDLDQFLERSGWMQAPAYAGRNVKHGVEFYAVAAKQDRSLKTERRHK